MSNDPTPFVGARSMKPSTSTVVSVAVGAPIAIVVAWLINEIAKVQMPAEVSTALGAVISTVIGYFFHGGQSDDTV